MKLCVINKKTNQEKYKILTEKKNREMDKLFSATPYKERIAFVPHCLRSSKKCKAKEHGSYFLCMECGECKINKISKKAKELGYKGIFILKGGRTIENLVKEFKPKAVLGVACYFEGAQGFELLKNKGKEKVVVQFVPLSKDGCVDTDVDLQEVLRLLAKK